MTGQLPDVAAAEQCPGCGAEVIAVRATEHPQPVWLADPVPLPAPERPGVCDVEFSASGGARVVQVVSLRVHRCGPGTVAVSLAGYDAAVLAVHCPVARCAALPGLACRSPRGMVLSRPHGARVASV